MSNGCIKLSTIAHPQKSILPNEKGDCTLANAILVS
jgi:hypothetical protein